MDEAKLIERVRELVAREEIREALMRYCRGVDRADESLMNSAFHPGAINDGGKPGPAADFARRVAAGSQAGMMHFTGNVLIEFDDDTAYVESYFVSFARQDTGDGASTRTRAGRYLDRFELRDGAWKIAHRLLVDDWARLDRITRVPDGVGAHSGSRDSQDPVFRARELLM